MKKTLLWSMLFLAWGGVISCSDDDKDGSENTTTLLSNVTFELSTGEENEITTSQLSSFDYFVWNTTQGEVMPMEGAIDGISSLNTTELGSGKLQLALTPENSYQFYGMAIRHVETDSNEIIPSNEKITETTSDPRQAVWMTDVNGELQNTDLFWGTGIVTSGTDSKLVLERVVGQISIELKKEENVTIDSIYLEMPGDKISTAILRDGTLVSNTENEQHAWKVPEQFFMLPMEEAVTKGVILHLYVSNSQGEAIDRQVSLDGINFQVRKNKCLRLILAGITWNEDGQIESSVKPIIEWGEIIPMNASTSDVENFIPGSELNTDMSIYYNYNQLATEAQKQAYLAICEAAKAFDDGGSPLPTVTILIPLKLNSTSEVTTISNAVTGDMPSFFHLNYVQNYYTYLDWVTCRFTYPYEDFVYKYKLAMKGADEILKDMPEGLSEFERAKYVWDHFLAYVSYGQLQGSADNIYGAFCIRKIVCEGYARAFQYLCQRVGIQALYRTGLAYTIEGQPGVNHAWNILRIDGKYYYCDPTFDDGMTTGSTTVRYDNFLKSKATFSKLHDVSPTDPEISEEDYPLDFLYE